MIREVMAFVEVVLFDRPCDDCMDIAVVRSVGCGGM